MKKLTFAAALLASMSGLTWAQGWQGVMVQFDGHIYMVNDSVLYGIVTPEKVECNGGYGKIIDVVPADVPFNVHQTEARFRCQNDPPKERVLYVNNNFKLNGNGSNHILAAIRANVQTGEVGGWFTYDNDSLVGFCGGIVVALYDKSGRQLSLFTPPSGCINGKLPGHNVTRRVTWGGTIADPTKNIINRLVVAPYPTDAPDKGPSRQPSLSSLQSELLARLDEPISPS